MKIIEIHGKTGYSKIVINDSLKNLKKYLSSTRTVIITDNNVDHYYNNQFPTDCNIIKIGTGEKIKNLKTVENIYKKLVELEIDRSCTIVGIGGGIVCDITGFVASTYMRGLTFGFVSSTLLSQVDASIGGKNGINFLGYKNMIGVFNQPGFVICDLEMLKTLPHKEILNGFSEIIKHAIIGNRELFSFLEKRYIEALNLDKKILERVICDSLTLKSSIVSRDETEQRERKKLNFGHTFGHAIEKTMGIPHGEAVSIGMVVATNLSVKRKILSKEESERIYHLLKQIKLPVEIKYKKGKILDAIKKDKKRKGKAIAFVLLKSIGETVIEEISIKELETVVNDMC